MSYLDVPRLHFSGRFIARTATVNNRLDNYDPSLPLQALDPDKPGYVEWHPRGTNEFRLVQCRITAVVDTAYRRVADDVFLNGAVGTDSLESSPKIVDLDPEQENVPALYGMHTSIRAARGDAYVEGLLDPPPTARDMWLRVIDMTQGDSARSVYFQSFLTEVRASVDASPIVQEMLRRGRGRLSLKFVTDAFRVGAIDPNGSYITTDPLFGSGRVVGFIGPASADEPSSYAAARRLVPTAEGTTPFGAAPFQLDAAAGRVTIDLSNSIPWQQNTRLSARGDGIGGGEGPAGLFTAAYRTPPGPTGTLTTLQPELDCSKTSYETFGGLFDLAISPQQAAALARQPLLVMMSGQSLAFPVLAERDDGICVENEPVWARLNAGETASVEVRVRKFGAALPGYQVLWQLRPASEWNNLPVDALRFQATPLVTDAAGRAMLHVTAGVLHDLPAERRNIESQVYFLGGPWDGISRGGPPGDMGYLSAFTVLVFPAGTAIGQPVWTDVEPLLRRYARLFPGMRAIVDLSNLQQLRFRRERLIDVLSQPIASPRYMPVTRDLPEHKRQTLLNWLRNGCPE